VAKHHVRLTLFQALFQITPLNWTEWKAVLYFSLPVVLIDEVLKFTTAHFVEKPLSVKIKKE
jgi:Ca2+ transporting ATPase